MLATIFLLGLIIGFLIGRLTLGSTILPANPAMGTNNVMNQGSTGSTAGTIADNFGTAINPTAAQQPTMQTNPVNDYTNIDKSVDSDGHFSLGNKNAKVKIVEFGDFQCPFCYRYFMTAFPQILTDYVATGKVYYTFHNYPLNIHPQAPKAAEASLCAADQNKYWEYHDLLFANQNLWSGNDNDVQVFENLAQSAGMDSGKFSQCLSSGKYTATVNADIASGDKKGISGTPTIFIDDQKVVGAQDYSVFKQTIDQELNKK